MLVPSMPGPEGLGDLVRFGDGELTGGRSLKKGY